METLPNEVALHVLGNLEKADLKAVRLTNRRYSSLCIIFLPSFFRRVYASLHRKDMEVLNHISSHPEFRLLVKELVYNGVRFSKTTLEGLEDGDPNLEYYQKRYDEEVSVLQANSHHYEIAAALSRMPNLQRVILTNHWLPTRDLLVGKCSPHERHMGVQKPTTGGRLSGPLSREYPAGLEEPQGLPLEVRLNNAPYPSEIDHAFTFMTRAFTVAKPQVQELVIDFSEMVLSHTTYKTTRIGISPETLNIPNENLHQYYDFFRHLRRLYFSIQRPESLGDLDTIRDGSFRNMLASAECLEELSLDFGDIYFCSDLDEFDMNMPLGDYLGPHCWRSLRLLRLYGNVCAEEELSELLERHCKSLKVLRLEFFRFKSGTWEEAAEKWHRWLQLESIGCYELYEYTNEDFFPNQVNCDEFENYVMTGKSGPGPMSIQGESRAEWMRRWDILLGRSSPISDA